MAIEGPIKELGLFELFQLISFAKKSGKLTIRRAGEDTHTLYFRDGLIIHMELEYRLGEELKKRGLLDENESIKDAIDSGKLKPNQIYPLFATMAENAVFTLLKLKDGYFTFTEEDVSSPWGMELNLRLENLLMEGARRIDEITKMSSVLEPDKTIPVISEEIEKMKYINLSPEEWEILSRIDGEKTINDICREMGDEFRTIKVLYGLFMAGVIKKSEVASKITPPAAEEEGLARGIEITDNLWKESNYREGIELLLRLRERFPDEPVIDYNLGFFYLRMGKWGEALTEFSRFISRTKDENAREEVRELLDKLKAIFEHEKKEGYIG